ncbi:MAG: hypothetical protein ACW97P_10495 [Candidatus Hodarchaeales archaeon]|jgi:hypothetical protein
MKRCENCCYYYVNYCRKHAPIIIGNESKMGHFPRVDFDYWCGDWEPKDYVDFKLGKYNEPSD